MKLGKKIMVALGWQPTHEKYFGISTLRVFLLYLKNFDLNSFQF
jgi:hypothetical protein